MALDNRRVLSVSQCVIKLRKSVTVSVSRVVSGLQLQTFVFRK